MTQFLELQSNLTIAFADAQVVDMKFQFQNLIVDIRKGDSF
jgi:hypothetical protein